MTEKEKILGRIREALTVSVRLAGAHHGETAIRGAVETPRPTSPTLVGRGVPTAPVTDPPNANAYSSSRARAWLPVVGESFDARLSLFKKNSIELKAAFHVLNDRHELATSLCSLRDEEKWKKIGFHSGELTNEAVHALNLPSCRTDQSCNVADLESCDAGITECDALVAQTGSVLVTARSAGGRALSVLPPHHVVLARREELIADLPDAFALLKAKYGPNYPSFISLITGPSRTGDIERILVLGAHGPKKLTIFLT